MKLTLGYSPCPNDTFIFDALVHNKIDTEGLEFEVVLQDVEALNQRAFQHDLDVTKLSYHAYGYLVDDYALLDAGSALGYNCGPLLISKNKFSNDELTEKSIAIPGKFTTANFLLSIAFPTANARKEVLFSEIEQLVLTNQMDAGLIIHENRFTYHERGLNKIMDLGEFWQEKTKLPIPLGGIVASRKLDPETIHTINRVLKRSVEYAFENPKSSEQYVRQHAQEMSYEVMQKHIDLYVNDFSIDLGKEGRRAITYLFEMALKQGIIPQFKAPLFLDETT